jgi:hypothetical protein
MNDEPYEYPYIVQVHGEWSGLPEYQWMDIDFECDTLKEARELINKEVPKGVPYILYGPDETYIEEGVDK